MGCGSSNSIEEQKQPPKERNIEKALKQSENQLDRDTKEFIDFVEATKRRK